MIEIEYRECLGCQGEYEPDYSRVDHKVSWLDENPIRSRDAYRFCCESCRVEFRERQKVLGEPSKRGSRPTAARQIRSPYLHSNSAIGMMERMFDNEICLICFSWNHIVFKNKNQAFCRNHLSKAPEGFKCKNKETKCKYKQEKEGVCPKCNVPLKPYWKPLPESMAFLYDYNFLPKWIYAQIAQGRGLARGLETLDRAAEILGLGNGSRILDNLKVVENKALLMERMLERGLE